MVSPKYIRKFIYPSTLGLVQLGAESLEDGSVHDFHLTVCLKMVDRHELVPNMEFSVEILESLVVELPAIIDDDSAGKSISVDD